MLLLEGSCLACSLIRLLLLLASICYFLRFSDLSSSPMPPYTALLHVCAQIAPQPFVDTSHPVQDFFLPRKYAIAIPTVLVILLVTLVATFIGLTLMKSARKQKLKSS